MRSLLKLMFASADPRSLIYDASAITGVADNAVLPFTSILDQSGNGLHCTSMISSNPASFAPLYHATGFPGGLPGMYFRSHGMFRFADISSWTELDAFIVVVRDHDPVEGSDNSFAPIWRLGSSNVDSQFPSNTHIINDDAGSTTIHNCGNPAPTLLTTPRLWNTISTGSEWTARLDTTQKFTTAVNTVGITAQGAPNPPTFGGRLFGGFSSDGFFGHIAEIQLYATKRTAAERSAIESALKAKWGLTGW